MKTVELIPTWETALRIVSMRLGAAKTRKQMAEAVKIFEESFLPLCRAVDQRNEEIRKEREAADMFATMKELTDGATATQSCGHSGMDADFRCCTCGADCSQG